MDVSRDYACVGRNVSLLTVGLVVVTSGWLLIVISARYIMNKGHAIVQFFEAMCCKPEDRGFGSRWESFEIFYWLNPSSRTVALGSTRSLIKMSTGIFPWRVNSAGA
jgi:hypothetical protein